MCCSEAGRYRARPVWGYVYPGLTVAGAAPDSSVLVVPAPIHRSSRLTDSSMTESVCQPAPASGGDTLISNLSVVNILSTLNAATMLRHRKERKEN